MQKRKPYVMSISRVSDGVFVEAGGEFAETLGLGAKRLRGRSAFSDDLAIWRGREDRDRFIALLRKRGEVTERDIDIRRHNAVLVFSKIFRAGGEEYLICCFRDTAERRMEKRQLQVYEEKLQELSSQLLLVEEKERRRIAAAIHDYIGQSLAFAHLKLRSLEEMSLTDDAKALLHEVDTMIELCLQHARSITFDLSPAVLYELGLGAAVEWQAERMQGQFGVSYRVKAEGDFSAMDTGIRVILFRTVQELLTNVVKHAKARNVQISLQRRGRRVSISIVDDGVGFTEGGPRASRGFGLFSIREQLSCIGGVLTIGSHPGRGTVVKIDAPLRKSGAEKNGRHDALPGRKR